MPGFAFVGVLAFGGLTKHFDRERGQALLWGSFHFFSVGLAIGAAVLVAYSVQGFLAWPLAAFLSTSVYLLVLQCVAVRLDDSASSGHESVLSRPQGEDRHRCWARYV